jgi:hypothetical protein
MYLYYLYTWDMHMGVRMCVLVCTCPGEAIQPIVRGYIKHQLVPSHALVVAPKLK